MRLYIFQDCLGFLQHRLLLVGIEITFFDQGLNGYLKTEDSAVVITVESTDKLFGGIEI